MHIPGIADTAEPNLRLAAGGSTRGQGMRSCECAPIGRDSAPGPAPVPMCRRRRRSVHVRLSQSQSNHVRPRCQDHASCHDREHDHASCRECQVAGRSRLGIWAVPSPAAPLTESSATATAVAASAALPRSEAWMPQRRRRGHLPHAPCPSCGPFRSGSRCGPVLDISGHSWPQNPHSTWQLAAAGQVSAAAPQLMSTVVICPDLSVSVSVSGSSALLRPCPGHLPALTPAPAPGSAEHGHLLQSAASAGMGVGVRVRLRMRTHPRQHQHHMTRYPGPVPGPPGQAIRGMLPISASVRHSSGSTLAFWPFRRLAVWRLRQLPMRP